MKKSNLSHRSIIPLLSIAVLLVLSLATTYSLFLKNHIADTQTIESQAETIFDSATCILGTGVCPLVEKELQKKSKDELKLDSKSKGRTAKELDLLLANKKFENISKKVTSMSSINGTQKVRYYTLMAASYPKGKTTESFYECSEGKDQGCAIEFMKVNPQYTNLEGKNQQLFPKNLLGTLRLVENKKDKKEDIPKGGLSPANHFYFTQRLNGKPVYGSYFDIHMRDGKKIYYAKGRVTTDPNVPKATISDKKLVEELLREARKKAPKDIKLTVRNKKTMVFNGELIGYDDPGNDLALSADVIEDSKNSTFATNYLISKTTGDILVENSLIKELLKRRISACHYTGDCKVYPSKKRPNDKNELVGKAFDWAGEVYQYFLSNFGRDSIDGRGSVIAVNIDDPNCLDDDVGATYANEILFLCTGKRSSTLAAFGHEYTHGVLESEVPGGGMLYKDQSGSLDEALADWFGTDIVGTWEIFADLDSSRNLKYPNSTKQPKDIFDASYYICSDNYDKGGVHINTGPINLALYKASEDPPVLYDNESCEETKYPPLGRAAVSRIVYHYLVSYMQKNDNFFDFYVDMYTACLDIYGNPEPCMALATSMQYTKLHKQVNGWPKSPMCYGQPEMTEEEAYEQACQRQRARKKPKATELPLPLYRKKVSGKKTGRPQPVRVETMEGLWAEVPISTSLIQQIYGIVVF